ncbi:MAG: hypothetical protein VCA37_03715 [Roseibacillus sp.]
MAAEVPKVEGPLKFEFRLSSNTSGKGVVFWCAKGQPFHRSRTQSITITHDAAFKNYAIDIEPAAPLAGLRLDPGSAPGEIRIEGIRLSDVQGKMLKEWIFRPRRARPLSVFSVQTDSVRPSPSPRRGYHPGFPGMGSFPSITAPAAFPATSTPVVAAFSATRTLAPTTVPAISTGIFMIEQEGRRETIPRTQSELQGGSRTHGEF